MNTVRCSICRQQLSTLKKLISHYFVAHSKLKVIKQLIKINILQCIPNLLKHKYKRRSKGLLNRATKLNKTSSNFIRSEETIYLNEDVQILCSQNEIIIGDGKNNVEMEFSFNENSSESKENVYLPFKDNNDNIIPNRKVKIEVNCKAKMRNKKRVVCSNSPSASSEGSIDNSEVVRRKIKYKKYALEKTKHYRINVTKLRDKQSLNEENGEFYICHCREKYKNPVLHKNDSKIITSDTESCSDASKHLFMPLIDTKVFCFKCGNGYSDKHQLAEHMLIHETFCRLCNEFFPNEIIFKQHMRLHIFKVYVCHICNREFHLRELLQVHYNRHIEEKTLDIVLDMEEDYNIHTYNFASTNYNSSINSILCFLSESNDIY